MNTSEDTLKQEWRDLLFSVRRSVRYHQHRVAFFDRLNKTIRFVALVSGASVITTALAEAGAGWVKFSAVVVALISALDLVVNTEGGIRRHLELVGRFLNLEKRMVQAGMATRELLLALAAERLEIEAGEPPVLRVLDCVCHNELLRAMGYTDNKDAPDFARIAWYQRLLADFFDVRAHAVKWG